MMDDGVCIQTLHIKTKEAENIHVVYACREIERIQKNLHIKDISSSFDVFGRPTTSKCALIV